MMEEIDTKPPYNFKVFFGFTDSTFFSDVKSPELITQFIQYFKDKLNVTIELKDVYVNSIFYGKKNQSVEWNDKETDRPIIKNPGNSRAQCKWVRKWFVDIVTEIVKHPETRFEKVPIMLKQAYADLKYIIDSGLFSQLKFTETMNQELNAYEENNRIRKLGTKQKKKRGDLVFHYKSIPNTIPDSAGYCDESKDINQYWNRRYLLHKLESTFEVTGIDYNAMIEAAAEDIPDKEVPMLPKDRADQSALFTYQSFP
jgi:DNA polymerase, archaea type